MLLLTAASLQPLPCAGVGASCPVIAHSISHLSNSHPVVGVISGDYILRRQSCRRMLTQKGAKMWRSRRNGRERNIARSREPRRRFAPFFQLRQPQSETPSEVGVYLDAKHSGLFRPAPQFIIRRCRCEGATPSSPLAVCMHKPAAEPINQSSIHPSISPSVALALPPFSPLAQQ